MDAADINRSIFNEEAASYDIKHRKLNDRLTRELQARLDFIGVDWASDDEDSEEEFEEGGRNRPRREVRLLDYACGTGMMSRAIAPYTTQCVGMDISEKMVAAYNARAENQGLLAREMHAIVGDLVSPTVSEDLMSKDLFDFDIAVVGGGFHHFADPELAAKRLVERLKPGGVLFIWDFLPHGPFPQEVEGNSTDKPHQHQHQHHNSAKADDHVPNGDPHHGGVKESHTPETQTETGAEGATAAHSHVLHSVMHHGFSEERIRAIFTAAGAGEDFGLEVVGGGFALNPHHAHGHTHTHTHTNAHAHEGHGHGDGDGDEQQSVLELDEHTAKEGLKRQVFFARGTKGARG